MDTQQLEKTILTQARLAKEASFILRSLSTTVKNKALEAIATALIKEKAKILTANALDIQTLSTQNPTASVAFKNRLILTEQKISALAEGIKAITELSDPVGEVVKMTLRPNGLRIGKIRIPIGVICCIYESRPNVTADIAALALKSGNACILRGGKESLCTNTAIAEIIREAASANGVTPNFLQFIATTDHAAVPLLAGLDTYIDLIIPRGGEKLIEAVSSAAKMPILRHRKGITHIYIDETANQNDAVQIVHNAKTSNPSACNSLEKVLIDSAIAKEIVPALVARLAEAGVEIRGCERTRALSPAVKKAEESDWATEYLDLIITMKVVDGLDQAIDHIRTYSTGLSDGIVTENYTHAWKFLTAIDSAATYVNASTRFTDGSEFGFGAEIGINTSKLHGMGPMGLEDLTVTKYIVFGQGQIRK